MTYPQDNSRASLFHKVTSFTLRYIFDSATCEHEKRTYNCHYDSDLVSSHLQMQKTKITLSSSSSKRNDLQSLTSLGDIVGKQRKELSAEE